MKSMFFKNKITGEQFICDNPNDIQTIDEIEYLLVRRIGTDRVLLMRKDILDIVPARTTGI
jgi:hypothetical protein